MPERSKTEKNPQMEPEKNNTPIVLRCIDFRTGKGTEKWLAEKYGLERGNYFLYASAGASGNPNGFTETIKTRNHNSTIAIDHEDCGFYKKNGDDSPQIHHHNLEVLGQTIHEQSPGIEYQYHLLPINDNRHDCKATAIILGQPVIVKLARERLDELGLSNNHDEIARPYGLALDDETIWNDLEISLALHHPKKIFLFERDEENAQVLIKKIKSVAEQIEVEPIFISTAA